MALQTSGAISLNQIHIEAGGSSGTQASLNDADIRGLIDKNSGAQMAFNEWYGASAAVDISFPRHNFGQNQLTQYNSTSSRWTVTYGFRNGSTAWNYTGHQVYCAAHPNFQNGYGLLASNNFTLEFWRGTTISNMSLQSSSSVTVSSNVQYLDLRDLFDEPISANDYFGFLYYSGTSTKGIHHYVETAVSPTSTHTITASPSSEGVSITQRTEMISVIYETSTKPTQPFTVGSLDGGQYRNGAQWTHYIEGYT
jgi:hypothetical protein